jgi:hypothetical protein
MRLKEVVAKLENLKSQGFIPTSRKGPTGVGHLAEKILGVTESNLAIPDIGGRVELKATRRAVNSPITLFTFNRGVWRIKQRELIRQYGYVDENGREALYSIVRHDPVNAQGFYLMSDSARNVVVLKNRLRETALAEWSAYVIAGKFMTKFDRLLLVFADNKIEHGTEFFHFNEAYLLENPTPEKFLQAFDTNELMIDLRMHLRESGGIRNHGTGFRIFEKNLIHLYDKKTKLL